MARGSAVGGLLIRHIHSHRSPWQTGKSWRWTKWESGEEGDDKLTALLSDCCNRWQNPVMKIIYLFPSKECTVYSRFKVARKDYYSIWYFKWKWLDAVKGWPHIKIKTRSKKKNPDKTFQMQAHHNHTRCLPPSPFLSLLFAPSFLSLCFVYPLLTLYQTCGQWARV